MEGKVALVTGASANIGLEIARGFAQLGASVVMVSRTESDLSARADEIAAETGQRLVPIAADVSVASDVERLSSAVHEEFDQIDVLVNNAYASGDTSAVPPLEIDDESWNIAFSTNVMAPYRLCQSFGSRMMTGRGGSIINVLSGSGFLPSGNNAPYGATKAALWMMTRYLAVQCAPKVRVNGLCPGITTGPTGPPLTEQTDRLLALTPMGRAGDPTEVAAAAAFLASDAGSFSTGGVLFVNGGRPW